jgi:hypothetical protein
MNKQQGLSIGGTDSMNMSDILDELVKPPVAEAPTNPSSFSFSTAKDTVGLPVESAKYVKSSCRLCYGRGFQTLLVGNGYNQDGTSNKTRAFRVCQCVVKGYTNARIKFDKEVEERLAAYA